MFKNYFKIAFRNLSRNKVHSIINIAGLALGLACAMLIILYVKDELSFDRFNKNVNNIYRVAVKGERQGIEMEDGNTGYLQGPRFTQNVPGIRSFVRIQGGSEDLKTGTEIQSQDLLYVDSSFFSVFTFPLLGGNPETCLTQPRSIVLSERETRKQFGTTNAIGKTIMVKEDSEFVPYNVTAVAKNCPKNGGDWFTMAKVNGDSAINFDYETVDESFLPLLKIPIIEGRNFSADYPSDSSHSVLVNESFVKKAGWKNPIGQTVDFWYNNNEKYTVIGVVKNYHYQSLYEKTGPQLFTMKRSNNYGTSYIKIKPGSASKSLKYIQSTFKKLFPVSPYSYTFKNDENIKNYEAEAKWKQIMLFSAVLTIFISCIGLFGLSVLAAEKRAKEIGIRKVLGASVQSVVTALSIDFLKLVLIAMIIAVPLAWMAANKWLEKYPYRIQISWGIFVSGGLLVIIIALITVSFQAIKAAMANPVDSLRSE
ncbi:MAG TPA: ABC transporter permease [Hanamia sp.]|nr:ABC transporter permease [Hanamia sp.]